MTVQDRPDLERALATHLGPVSRAWRLAADRLLASLGVSNSAGWALLHLRRLGDGARQAELARAVGVTEASLVRTVHQLERAGLVRRAADEADRRANTLHCTPEGDTLAGRIDARLTDLRAELTAGVPDADLAATIRVLERVGDRIASLRGAR